jgi:hypothetical protein
MGEIGGRMLSLTAVPLRSSIVCRISSGVHEPAAMMMR